jgi:hypothetical protein
MREIGMDLLFAHFTYLHRGTFPGGRRQRQRRLRSSTPTIGRLAHVPKLGTRARSPT